MKSSPVMTECAAKKKIFRAIFQAFLTLQHQRQRRGDEKKMCCFFFFPDKLKFGICEIKKKKQITSVTQVTASNTGAVIAARVRCYDFGSSYNKALALVLLLLPSECNFQGRQLARVRQA